MVPWDRENEIFNSLQRARELGELAGEKSGRGIPGDICADRQLAHDIANGVPVRDALERQRAVDDLVGDRRSHGAPADMLTDDLIARDVENGMDIGDAMMREEAWGRFFDRAFDE